MLPGNTLYCTSLVLRFWTWTREHWTRTWTWTRAFGLGLGLGLDLMDLDSDLDSSLVDLTTALVWLLQFLCSCVERDTILVSQVKYLHGGLETFQNIYMFKSFILFQIQTRNR